MKNSTDLNEIPVLTDKETLEEVVDCLSKHISIDTEGAFNQTDLFNILVRAASQKDTIENTASTLNQVTGGNNIRYHLNKINNFEQLETELNLALVNQIHRGIKKSHLKLAIDLNLIPYYGNPSPEELPYIYRSKAKNGTCSFYAYATLYAIKKNKRVTLAIRGGRWSDPKVALITYLLASLTHLNLKGKIQKLYLDREFFSIAIIRWLKALDIPFIMPAIRRGKQGGIKQFLKGKKSYKTTYTMGSGEENSVTFNLWIVGKYKKGKLLFIGISFLLVNIWINILWRKISKPRRGGRLIYREIFNLKQMLEFLRQAVDRIYQVREAIYLPSD